MLFADNTGPDQPVQDHRLIRAFVVCLQNQWILQYMSMNWECSDQTAWMCILIWTFADGYGKSPFSHIVHRSVAYILVEKKRDSAGYPSSKVRFSSKWYEPQLWKPTFCPPDEDSNQPAHSVYQSLFSAWRNFNKMHFSLATHIVWSFPSKLSMLGKNFRWHFQIFFSYFFPQNRIWQFMKIIWYFKYFSYFLQKKQVGKLRQMVLERQFVWTEFKIKSDEFGYLQEFTTVFFFCFFFSPP